MQENELDKEIKKLTFPIVVRVSLPKTPTPVELLLFQRGVNELIIGLHWVIKLDWDKKHKIPANRDLAATLKPFGEYLHQSFLLCEAVHARQKSLPYQLPGYTDASDWFLSIFKEKIGAVFFEACNSETLENSKNEVATYDGHEKRRYIRTILENPRLVEKNINPFKKFFWLSHLSNLLDAAIFLSKESSNFKEKHLLPFTKSWRKALQNMERPEWQRQFTKDDKLYQQYSKGKGVKFIGDSVTEVNEPEILILWDLQDLTAKT
jgi:hypothetical protein